MHCAIKSGKPKKTCLFFRHKVEGYIRVLPYKVHVTFYCFVKSNNQIKETESIPLSAIINKSGSCLCMYVCN